MKHTPRCRRGSLMVMAAGDRGGRGSIPRDAAEVGLLQICDTWTHLLQILDPLEQTCCNLLQIYDPVEHTCCKFATPSKPLRCSKGYGPRRSYPMVWEATLHGPPLRCRKG